MKKYFFSIIPFGIILLLVIYLFGNTLLPPKGKIIDGGDIYNVCFFWKNFLSENIRNGIIPFWNPYNFSGTPFFAHPDINLFYPLNWIYVIFPLNQSFSLYFFLNMLIASVTMYWLGKQFTNIWGATATAIIYVLGGFFATRIYSGHLEYVDAAAWVPLTFGMGIRLIEEPGNKNLVKFSISLTLLILSGNELFFLFTMEMLFLYLIFFMVINNKKKRL